MGDYFIVPIEVERGREKVDRLDMHVSPLVMSSTNYTEREKEKRREKNKQLNGEVFRCSFLLGFFTPLLQAERVLHVAADNFFLSK